MKLDILIIYITVQHVYLNKNLNIYNKLDIFYIYILLLFKVPSLKILLFCNKFTFSVLMYLDQGKFCQVKVGPKPFFTKTFIVFVFDLLDEF